MYVVLSFLKETATIGLVVLLGVIVSIGIIESFYLWERHFNTSVGVVTCDDSQVYTGRLYRVDDTLETKNLQAPMFSVKIRGKNNFFRTEAAYFCKEFRISGKE